MYAASTNPRSGSFRREHASYLEDVEVVDRRAPPPDVVYRLPRLLHRRKKPPPRQQREGSVVDASRALCLSLYLYRQRLEMLRRYPCDADAFSCRRGGCSSLGCPV